MSLSEGYVLEGCDTQSMTREDMTRRTTILDPFTHVNVRFSEQLFAACCGTGCG